MNLNEEKANVDVIREALLNDADSGVNCYIKLWKYIHENRFTPQATYVACAIIVAYLEIISYESNDELVHILYSSAVSVLASELKSKHNITISLKDLSHVLTTAIFANVQH